MFKWGPFPFARYVFVMIAGMLFYIHAKFYSPALPWTLVGLAIVYYSIEKFTPSQYRKQMQPVMGMLGLACLGIVSIIITYQRTEESRSESYLLQQSADTITHYQAVIVSAVQKRPQSYRAEAEVRAIEQDGHWKPAQGRILLSFDKRVRKPEYGDLLLIQGQPFLVKPPANPEEFDYRQYLRYQHITHQQYIKPYAFLVLDHTSPNPVMPFAVCVASYAEKVLTKAIGERREYAVANALILGIRDELDYDTMSAYAASGAMHILSVSGLHVGILFLILDLGLRPMKRVRFGRIWYAVIMLGLLWFYAFVTALSPSVLRSVTMFSFVVIGQAMSRQSNVYNTLAMSALLLLCWEPYFLMSVGFQLSYLAVIGIVWLTPGLIRLIHLPDPYASYRQWRFWKRLKTRQDYEKFYTALLSKSLDWLWSSTCVSIAAQLITFPLGLYYFHQFPTYFLLANPIVLLLSALVLPLGLALTVLSWVPVLGYLLSMLLKGLLWLLNSSVFLTEKLPYALVSGSDFSWVEVVVLYAFLLFLIRLFEFRRFQYLWVSLMLVLILVGINGNRLWQQQRQRTIVMHSIRQHSVMSLIEGNHAWLFSDSAFVQNRSLFNFHLAGYWSKKGVAATEQLVWGKPATHLAIKEFGSFSLLVWQGKSFLFVDKPLRNQQIQLPPIIDYLIIRRGAVKNLEVLATGLSVRHLILDNTNKPYLVARLSEQAADYGIPCHDLAKQGAWMVEL